MKQTVLLAAIVAILSQGSPVFAQDARLLPQGTLHETGTRPERSDPDAAQRSAQMMPVPHVHRNVSFRRVALGALIGGAAGAAVGYGLASRSCGASSSPQECAGYGRLGAVMAGGGGGGLGVPIAVGRA